MCDWITNNELLQLSTMNDRERHDATMKFDFTHCIKDSEYRKNMSAAAFSFLDDDVYQRFNTCAKNRHGGRKQDKIKSFYCARMREITEKIRNCNLCCAESELCEGCYQQLCNDWAVQVEGYFKGLLTESSKGQPAEHALEDLLQERFNYKRLPQAGPRAMYVYGAALGTKSQFGTQSLNESLDAVIPLVNGSAYFFNKHNTDGGAKHGGSSSGGGIQKNAERETKDQTNEMVEYVNIHPHNSVYFVVLLSGKNYTYDKIEELRLVVPNYYSQGRIFIGNFADAITYLEKNILCQMLPKIKRSN